MADKAAKEKKTTHATKAKQQARTEFEQLVEASNDAVRVIKKDFTIRYINQAFTEMTGVDSDDAIGKRCWEVFPGTLCHTAECRAHRVFHGEEKIKVEIERQKPDGATIPCDVTTSPLRDNSGNVGGIIEQFRDITEMRHKEEEIRESEDRYRALIELGVEAGEAVVMLQDHEDAEGVQVFVNDYWPCITGYAKEELIGTSFFNLVSPDDRQTSMERHRQKMSGKAIPGMFEINIISKNGTKVPLELTGTFTHYQRKKANVLYLRDVTERKRLEKALIDDETRYTFLFENVPVFLSESDFSLLKIHFDELRQQGVTNFREYFNKHPNAIFECNLLTKHIRGNKAFHSLFQTRNIAEVNKYFYKGLQNSVQNRSAMTDDYVRLANGLTNIIKEEKIHTFEQRPIQVLTHIFVPPEYTDSWSRIIVSLYDITELKQKEKELRRSASRFRSLSKQVITAQEEERSTIARELHDQLGQDLLSCKMVALSLAGQMKDATISQRTIELSNMLSNVVKKVQQLSLDLRPQLLDNLGFIKAGEFYADDFSSKMGIKCSVNIFKGDTQMFSSLGESAVVAFRIIQEALANVSKHSKATKAYINVSIKNRHLVVSVKDNGIGMDKSAIDNKLALGILGMHERAHIVGGDIHIRSRVNKGTTVTVRLPIL
jgi:PAS domain S-box-containing protein